MKGVATAGSFLPILGFFGADKWSDIVDWAQDTF
jgi:hypothetical protein